MEKRTYSKQIETRAEDNGILYIKGYAALYGIQTTIYESRGAIDEVIMPGAFADSDLSDVRLLLNHDPNYIYGRTIPGTLKVGADELGLFYEGYLNPENQSHRDLHDSIKRGDIDQSSFAFAFAPEGFTIERTPAGNNNIRRITNIAKVYDVSPVTYPAYASTTVVARAEERAEFGKNIIKVKQSEIDAITKVEDAIKEAIDLSAKFQSSADFSGDTRNLMQWMNESLNWKIEDIQNVAGRMQLDEDEIRNEAAKLEARLLSLRSGIYINKN